MKAMHNQKGFSAVEAILIIVIIAAIGLGGWYVWKKQNTKDAHSTTNSQKQSESSTKESAQEATPDPTADWVTYSNATGKFSFKHPAAWVFADNPQACTEGLVLFAPVQTALGKCATESGGQMMVLGTEGDVRSEYKIGQGYLTEYTGVVEVDVTVDGVTGIKQTATASGQEDVGALPDGTKIVQYVFYANGKTYLARYTQYPAYPDVVGDFNKLVTQTLKFLE
jgi:hypothetical protein